MSPVGNWPNLLGPVTPLVFCPHGQDLRPPDQPIGDIILTRRRETSRHGWPFVQWPGKGAVVEIRQPAWIAPSPVSVGMQAFNRPSTARSRRMGTMSPEVSRPSVPRSPRRASPGDALPRERLQLQRSKQLIRDHLGTVIDVKRVRFMPIWPDLNRKFGVIGCGVVKENQSDSEY